MGIRKIACPVKGNKLYKQTWALITDDLVARDNFKPSHYRIAERICELTVQLAKLRDFLNEEGFTQKRVDKYGNCIGSVARPEVAIYSQIHTQLRGWEARAGITPYKDSKLTETEDAPKSKWD